MKSVVLDPGPVGQGQNAALVPAGTQGLMVMSPTDTNFAVARQAAAALAGSTVVLTRGPHDNPSVEERVAVANNREASAFVSIHSNGVANSDDRFRVWVHESAGVSSNRLAVAILQELAAVGTADSVPGVAAVGQLDPSLHADQTAACYVDLGNASALANGAGVDGAFADAVGRAIARAISAYLNNETVVPPAVATQLSRSAVPVAGALAMVTITHAGSYRLAYDRHTRVGELGRDRDTRNFQGTQALQDALNGWATLIPTVMTPPAYVLTAGLYVNKSGEHGRGNAVDVDGFWWSDSNTFLAKNAPSDWYTYLTIEASLRKHFGTVLNYDYNADHHDHWHCDLGYPTTWRTANSQVVFVKRALKEIWGANLTVNRTWDSDAAAAATNAGYDLSTPGAWDHFLDDLVARQSTPAAGQRWIA